VDFDVTGQLLIIYSEFVKYLIKIGNTIKQWGTAVAQCLRCCATNRKVAGLIPANVIGIFH